VPEQRAAAGQAGEQDRLCVLLLRVVEEPGPGDRREREQRRVCRVDRAAGLGGEGGGDVALPAVGGADGPPGRLDGEPARRQGDLAGGVRRAQLVSGEGTEPFEVRAVPRRGSGQGAERRSR